MRTIGCAALTVVFGLAIAISAQGFTLSVGVQDSSGASLGGFSLDDLQAQGRIASSVEGDITRRSLSAATQSPSGSWTIDSWHSQFDPDPFITNDFQVTNNTAGDLVFSMMVSGSVSPQLTVAQIVQSNVILSLNDADGAGGATLMSAGGDPIYQGLVNGLTELTFLDDPYSLSCADPVDCALNGRDADAVATQALGPISASEIGISVKFKLSAGDSAAVLSRFEVIVPEPTTALLVAAGCIALGFARRSA